MIVVDASVALAGLLTGGASREVLAAEPLHAPHLVDSEIAHALRRRVAAGAVEADAAWRALDVWCRLGVTRHGTTAHLERVWELRENLSAYDATYVALAEALGCGLVTADGRLGRAPGPRCPVTILPS